MGEGEKDFRRGDTGTRRRGDTEDMMPVNYLERGTWNLEPERG